MFGFDALGVLGKRSLEGSKNWKGLTYIVVVTSLDCRLMAADGNTYSLVCFSQYELTFNTSVNKKKKCNEEKEISYRISQTLKKKL